MSSDPNKKSPRTFQCRDMLWETFEQMARELECSVDYLINEAMKQYARQRSYGGARPIPLADRCADAAALQASIASRDGGRSGYASAPPPPVAPPPSMRGAMPTRGQGGGLPPPPPRGGGALPAPPPPPRGIRSGMPGMQRSAARRCGGAGRDAVAAAGAPRSAPPPIPARSSAAPARCRPIRTGGGGYNGGGLSALARRSASSTRARRSASRRTAS